MGKIETLNRFLRDSGPQIVDDRPADKVFRVSPKFYSDSDIFELEMVHLFAKTWIFLGIAGDIPQKNDYLTSKIGRVPVLVTRLADGSIRAFQNVCRHRGAVLCRAERGNSSLHICPYHHWSYAPDGRLVGVKDKAMGAYPENFFDDLGLKALPRTAEYRGLIFGSLSADVPSLDEFLGDARYFIDLIIDQGADGIESIPGRTPYFFRANWKLQAENGLDGYHVTSTHSSMIAIQRKKQKIRTTRSVDWNQRFEDGQDLFNFRYGHAAQLHHPHDIESRPFFASMDAIRQRLGDGRTDEILCTVQLHIFPNLQIASGVVPIIRKFQPEGVAETKMEVTCIGMIGEPAEQRTIRLRQYEDFFNATGLATPDDSVVYEDIQRGCEADIDYFYGYSRGAGKLEEGANPRARDLGLSPAQSTHATAREAPETVLQSPHREWLRMMQAAASGARAYGE